MHQKLDLELSFVYTFSQHKTQESGKLCVNVQRIVKKKAAEIYWVNVKTCHAFLLWQRA